MSSIAKPQSRWFAWTAIFLLGLLSVSKAQADDCYTMPLNTPFNGTYQASVVTPPPASVDATKAVGATLSTAQTPMEEGGGGYIRIQCLDGKPIGTVRMSMLLPVYDAANNLVNVGVSNVAARVTYPEGQGFFPWTTYISDWNYNLPFNNARWEFVKTGDITAPISIRPAGVAIRLSITRDDGTVYNLVDWSFNSTVQLIPNIPACKVDTASSSNMTVDLDPVSASTLAANGTAGAKDFSIILNCTGGASGTFTNVYMTLSDANSAGNRTNRLTQISTGSDATGAAIQILNKGTPVSFGPDSRVKNNPGQFFVKGAGNETLTIPFTARYIATGSNVTPGTVRSIATFTMSFQ